MARDIRTTRIKVPPALSNEDQLRAAVKSNVLDKYVGDPDTVIINELGLRHGAARVDIAVVNGIIHGFELKSDSDNLKRLPRQVEIYNSVLDKVTLVVGGRHADAATTLVPEWWGITIAKTTYTDEIDFEPVRQAQANPCLDPISICRLLWREEAINLLDELGVAASVRHKPRGVIYSRLAEVVDLATIQRRVRRQLKFRIAWRSDPPRVVQIEEKPRWPPMASDLVGDGSRRIIGDGQSRTQA